MPSNSRGPKPGTFDFLGFTHISGRNRRGGYALIRKTMRKRWQAKLHEVRAELRRRMHDTVPEHGKYLRAVVDGHFRYYGVPGNGPKLGGFRGGVMRVWYWTLRRRGQAHPLTKKRFYCYVDRWLPNVRIHHPWPSKRLDVTTQGKSRMR